MAGDLVGFLDRTVLLRLRAFRASGQPRLYLAAFAVGLAVSAAALLFYLAIGQVQRLWLGTSSERVLGALADAPWWLIVAGPVAGGLVVGLMLQFLLPSRQTFSITDVVEARVADRGRLRLSPGLWSAAATTISLGAGASAGREGPIVHLGGTVASWLASRLGLGGHDGRVLIGAGAASAIAASFNSPLAGVLFAHEVVLGHYGMGAFVPTVIAAAAAVVPARIILGDHSLFAVPDLAVTSLAEFPAFALLGIVAGMVAVVFQWSLVGTDLVARRVPIPLWLRPVLGGAALGAMGLVVPEILGIGYEAVAGALQEALPLGLLILLVAAKTAATAITLASRFGGGIVGPSLFLGTMTGAAFAQVAAGVAPALASDHTVYAILGMAAVAAAVLGAPISTAVMAFEITGGFEISIALLLTVSIATATTQAFHGRSLIQWQLEMRGVFLTGGTHRHMMRSIKVADMMVAAAEGEPQPDVAEGRLLSSDNLAQALKVFESRRAARIPVFDPANPDRHVGWVEHVAALRTFNEALLAEEDERHR